MVECVIGAYLVLLVLGFILRLRVGNSMDRKYQEDNGIRRYPMQPW